MGLILSLHEDLQATHRILVTGQKQHKINESCTFILWEKMINVSLVNFLLNMQCVLRINVVNIHSWFEN